MSKAKLKVAVKAEPEVKESHTFSVVDWKGKVKVFVCETCNFSTSTSRDDMVLHIVGHYPESMQESVLTELMKEK